MKTSFRLVDCSEALWPEDAKDHPFLTIDLIPENDAERVLLELLESLELHPESIGFEEEKGFSTIYFNSFPNNRKEDEKEEKQDGLAED